MNYNIKDLLYEDFMSGEVVFNSDKNIISESVFNKKGRLEITIPVGVVDKPTGNGRIYEKKELIKVLENLNSLMSTGAIHGTHGEHPNTFNVRPDEVSHLVTEAWVDDQGFIWNKWLIVNTTKGKDLTELFLSGARIGVSIRGRGVEVSESAQKYVREYEYGGTDTVSLPSTGLYVGTATPNVLINLIGEEQRYNACKNIIEVFENKNASVSDVGQDKPKIEENKMELKESEIKIKELEAKIKEFGEALTLAEEIKLEKETKIQEALLKIKKTDEAILTLDAQKKDMVERIEKLEDSNNKAKEYSETTEEAISNLKEYTLKLEDTLQDMTGYAVKVEGVLEEAVEYIKSVEEVTEDLTIVAKTSFAIGEELRNKITDNQELVEIKNKYEASVALIDGIKKDMTENFRPKNIVDDKVHNAVGFALRKQPHLKPFTEEMYACNTLDMLHGRITKYLNILENSNHTNNDIYKMLNKESNKSGGELRSIPGFK